MIVDSSALVAILKRKPEGAAFSKILEETREVRASAATYFETCILLTACESRKLRRFPLPV